MMKTGAAGVISNTSMDVFSQILYKPYDYAYLTVSIEVIIYR